MPYTDEMDGNEELQICEGVTDRVQMEADTIALEEQNRKFLHQSWAKIVESEEAEQKLLRQLEEGDATEIRVYANDFQIVKSSKAARKKTPVKRNYGTRAKSGNPKPFR